TEILPGERQNPAEFILESLHEWEKTLSVSTSEDIESVRKQISALYNQNPHYFPFEITEATLSHLSSNGLSEKVIKKLSLLKHQEWFWRSDFLDALERHLDGEYTDQAGITILNAVVQTGEQQDVSQIPYEKPREIPPAKTSFFHQFRVLAHRNLSIASADSKNRLFQVIQPVAIGLLMLIAFTWYAQDYYGEDILSRVGYEFTQKLGKQTIVPKQQLPAAKYWAYQQKLLLGEGSARLRASVFFLLIASCLWFGIINACREIVDERPVLKREAKSTLRISSYLAAKMVLLAWICLQQVALLVAVAALPNLLSAAGFLPPGLKESLQATQLITRIPVAGVFLILWLTSILASWTGLLISALAPTQQFALTAVPLVIIPQLLFGGLIRPIKDIDNTQSFMITRNTLEHLKTEGLTEEFLLKLADMQDQRFTEEHDFWFAVEATTGEKPGIHLKNTLLQYTSMRQEGTLLSLTRHIHDIMLQKWAFQIMLLYDSLGDVHVLRKIIDVNKYHKEEYLQFEQVELVELFFDIALSDIRVPVDEANDRQNVARTLLSRVVSGVILYHFVLLVIPTYIIIRKTTQA
ncbi:hypothetical protein GF348_16760, partial [candidate division KSB3 bacterium]|nr:hypothetical protein [candidate division KSB3 bacterium]